MQRGYVDRPDCRVYYEVSGQGPVLVFAHGLGGNHLSWWQQVPHFRDRYTCVTFSHRGFAPSSAPPDGPDPAAYAGDLAAIVDHIGASDIRIVAQSMGGWTALEYAFTHPGRVKAMVLAATSGTIARNAPYYLDAAPRPAWEREAARAPAIMESGIHVAGGERLAREQPSAHFLYQEIDALSPVDKMALRKKLEGAWTRPADMLRTLNVPTLWLAGEEDIVYPPFFSDVLSPMMPNSRVVKIERAGHSVYFERPGQFNKAVDEFLKAHG